MIANIALDDALILPHRANPRRIEFSGTTGAWDRGLALLETLQLIELQPSPLIARRFSIAYDRFSAATSFYRKAPTFALPLRVLHAWTMDAGDISALMVPVSPTKRCGKTSVLYRGSGMHPEAKFHAAVRWLREQARARKLC
jgi:hypothetical protein